MLGLLPSVPTWLQVTLGLTAVVLALLYFYLTATFSYWKDKGVKFVKPYPVVGSILSMMAMQEHPLHYNQRIYNEYEGEPFVGYFQSRMPTLMIRDPMLVKQVFVKDFAHFVDHGFKMHEEADPLQAKNLFNMEGQRWKEMRAKLTPTFTSGRMKAMFPLINECAEQFETHLAKLARNGEEFEAKDLLSRYTTDVIGSCAFGIKCDSLSDPNCEFRVMGKKLIDVDFWRAIKMIIIVFLPELSYRLRLAFIDKELTQFFRTMVRNVIEMRARTGVTRKDFMQLLIELKEKGQLSPEEDSEEKEHVHHSSLKLSDDDVTAQATVFFLAGFETSSTVMNFALLELAVNPDVQRKTQTEIDEVLQRHDGQLSYQAVQEMHYLDWVLQESMRKYPPVATHMRVCTKNYVIPGTEVTIEEGTLLTIPAHAFQNDPKYFPDPDRFEPERFSDDLRSQKNQYVYLPFGEGPRACIGNRFAMLQSKLGLIAVLRKFDVKSCSRTKYPAVIDVKQFILQASDGVWLKVVPRCEE